MDLQFVYLEHPEVFTKVIPFLHSFSLLKAKDIGMLEGFVAERNGEAIMHLQFADDTILFSSLRREVVLAVKRILRIFQLVFGLKVNLYKSSLVGAGCVEEVLQPLANNIHFKVGRLLTSYLGLALGVAGARASAI